MLKLPSDATGLHVCLDETNWPMCSVSATAWRGDFQVLCMKHLLEAGSAGPSPQASLAFFSGSWLPHRGTETDALVEE